MMIDDQNDVMDPEEEEEKESSDSSLDDDAELPDEEGIDEEIS